MPRSPAAVFYGLASHAYALSAWQEMEEAALKVMEAARDAEGVLATHAAALGAATAELERQAGGGAPSARAALGSVCAR